MSRSAFPLPPNATIGIVGGGQLGRMAAMAAARLGYRCHILTAERDSPAAQVAAAVTLGEYEDPAALADFASRVDVVTFEFENVSAAGLDLLAALKPVRPAPAVLRVSQDRIAEKSFLNGAGVPTAPWRKVASYPELVTAAARIGLPAILKTTRLGYDGKGQRVAREPADLEPAFTALAPKPLILEGLVDFACEISVIAARSADGQVVAFDAVENRHFEQILDLTLVPAPLPVETVAAARQIALRVAAGLDLAGLIAVEMFVDKNGQVLANEIAPRPHNSGHWTIDACAVSQFEMFVRAVAGLPLPEPRRHSDAVMKNLVGREELSLWSSVLATPGLIPHLYGKAAARPGRKMGHVTRLFPLGSLPGAFGIRAALAPLRARAEGAEAGARAERERACAQATA
ncbi:MAG: 5-(carboxyamino)imidazole ribonucleotide synthase [Acetobacteraceae bacterium]